MTETLSREVAIDRKQTALLFIDMQNFAVKRNGGEYKDMPEDEFQSKCGWYFQQLATRIIPNQQKLQAAARKAKVEVMYTTIESLTADGRDRSLDYKITGFHVPRGSWDGQVIDELKPGADEIWLPKTSSSVFVSTHIDYILRNLGVKQLVLAGIVTDQCVESAIRDACDLGYLVTQVTDACTTYTQERHDFSIRAIKGYCRQRTTDQVLAELA
jgi:ureidoacrylate peracid hydrolase